MKICNLKGWEDERQKTGKTREEPGEMTEEKGSRPAAFLKLDAYSELFPIVSDTLALVLRAGGGEANFPLITTTSAHLS